MSPSRTSLQALSRMLDAAAQPVYAVDDEGRIVLANFALAEWCGRSPEELAGQCCRYHSTAAAGSIEAVAAALCPPPEAFAGSAQEGRVCVAANGAARRRAAQFVPLSAGDGAVIGVLAVLGGEDAPSGADSEDAVELHAALQEFHRSWPPRREASRLVGVSPAIRRVQAQAALATASDVDLVIVGPAGSGRSHIARVIHESRGGEAPLEELAGAEASAERIDRAVAAVARRGALLVTEVDCLSDDQQYALLQRLAGRDFRVLATARTSPLELAAGGTFRPELAHLLSTLTLEVPPLSARQEDLPLLAQAFVEERNAEGAKQVAGFAAEALAAIAAYPWPGDVAELREAVREAHDAADGPRIAPHHLPSRLRIGAAPRPRRSTTRIVLGEYLERVERELIEQALAQAKGNKTKAARALGITRPRLYRRMVQLGLAVEAAEAADEAIPFEPLPGPEDFEPIE